MIPSEAYKVVTLEHGSPIIWDFINQLGGTPPAEVLAWIERTVALTPENLRTLIEVLELTGAGLVATADCTDAADVAALDASYQLKHALEDRLATWTCPCCLGHPHA